MITLKFDKLKIWLKYMCDIENKVKQLRGVITLNEIYEFDRGVIDLG